MIGRVMTFLGRGPGRDFVLLALPKTASTSLERTLTPYATEVVSAPPHRKHLPARGFVHTVAHDLDAAGHPRESYELVTMFREPIAWLESWWRYRARDDSRRSTADMTFEQFARHYLAGDGDAPVPKGRPAKFIHAQGAVAVDRLFSVDRPDVWAAWFSERVGAPLEFERRNTSAAERGELSAATRAALTAHFAPEYDVWRRVVDTGEWAGARGTLLPDLAGPGPAQDQDQVQ
ncbi:hypothetical protein SAMN05192575_106153 [Nocardioides alpinus]|uniref:Sulfotransferase family protein n=1 Tax=Nocardioides alpinus TaxID=748909 RepID=A0A1I0ZQA1_9ACTN|nr:hypothetical protein [Nocardioides alpinus]PKH41862.1 hypothetical protein CXG46_08380 [Nocardioides alpinus]SFB27894.1 hypothetical protein SAMN05192575_106153 [Nocardioides alpinus]